MESHSSILPWSIPWTEKPGRLQSGGLQGRKQLKRLSMRASPSMLNPGGLRIHSPNLGILPSELIFRSFINN